LTWVIDASVAVKWVLQEQHSSVAEEFLAQDLLAPALLQIECANVFWHKVLKQEMDAAVAEIALRAIFGVGIELVADEALLLHSLSMANQIKHPVYDCLYAALAELRGAPMVTADEKFVRTYRTKRLLETPAKILLLSEIT
jgi:predicted nucleic acid-binding protein